MPASAIWTFGVNHRGPPADTGAVGSRPRGAEAEDLFRWASALSGAGGHDVALPLWRELLDEHPDDVNLLARLARSYSATGAPGRALELLATAPESDRGVDVRAAEVDALIASARAGEAVLLAEELLRELPDSYDLQALVAWAASAAGDHARALALAHALVEVDEHPASLRRLAGIAAAADQSGIELQALDRLLDKCPSDEHALHRKYSLLRKRGEQAAATDVLVALDRLYEDDDRFALVAADIYYKGSRAQGIATSLVAVPVPPLNVLGGILVAMSAREWRRQFSPEAVALARRGKKTAWRRIAGSTWVAALLFGFLIMFPIVLAAALANSKVLFGMGAAIFPFVYVVRAEGRRNRRERRQQRIASPECRCDEDIALLLGVPAKAFASHLETHAHFETRGVVELRCPGTGAYWMEWPAGDEDVVLVRLADGARVYDPVADLPGLYL